MNGYRVNDAPVSNVQDTAVLCGWLACLIAVCEKQIDDKCDPASIYHKDGRPHCTIDCLIDALVYLDTDDGWRLLGGRAANWLDAICTK